MGFGVCGWRVEVTIDAINRIDKRIEPINTMAVCASGSGEDEAFAQQRA
jgi:hypothetical protein